MKNNSVSLTDTPAGDAANVRSLSNMELQFQQLAFYNKNANESLYDACEHLSADDYTRARKGSFGSIHGLLNHMLLADQIWMARFKKQGGNTTPPLNSVLFDSFEDLRDARGKCDSEIVAFFMSVSPSFWDDSIHYVNSLGVTREEKPLTAVLHFRLSKTRRPQS